MHDTVAITQVLVLQGVRDGSLPRLYPSRPSTVFVPPLWQAPLRLWVDSYGRGVERHCMDLKPLRMETILSVKC